MLSYDLWRCRRINDDEPFGRLTRKVEKSSTNLLVKRCPLGLEAASTSRRLAPPEADIHRQIQNEGQIGTRRREEQLMQGIDPLEADFPGNSLIDAGAISEAVREHPATSSQGRRNQAFDMIEPGGGHQQGFDIAAPTFHSPIQDKCTNGFRTGRPTGFPREDWLDRHVAQIGSKRLELGCLAGTLPAFERDEYASIALSLLRPQLGAPQMRYCSVPVILPSTPALSTASAATSGRTRVGWSATVSSIWPMI